MAMEIVLKGPGHNVLVVILDGLGKSPKAIKPVIDAALFVLRQQLLVDRPRDVGQAMSDSSTTQTENHPPQTKSTIQNVAPPAPAQSTSHSGSSVKKKIVVWGHGPL